MYKKVAQVALIFVFLISTFSLTAEERLLRIKGSNTIGERLMPALVESWLEENNVQSVQTTILGEQELHLRIDQHDFLPSLIEISSHGSSTGFQALHENQVELAMSSRAIRNSEVESLLPLGTMNTPEHEVVLALDGVAVIIHPNNPLKELSVDKLQHIFTGDITDWSEVTDHSGPINVYARDNNSGTYEVFKNLVLREGKIANDTQRYESNALLAADVANDELAIGFTGFTGFAYVEQSGAKAVAISDGGAAVLPTRLSIATEDYPLSRRLFLYISDPLDPIVQSFVTSVLSNKGQKIVAKEQFIALDIFSSEVELPKYAPAEYLELIDQAQRLSLNFRFDQSQARLDSKAARDIDRLVEYIFDHSSTVSELMILGFSDSLESTEVNSQILSVTRADSIAKALIESGVPPTRVRGYGSAIPVADSQSESGAAKNRRVEVWIKTQSEDDFKPYSWTANKIKREFENSSL